jgi:hypothetical protein
MPLCGAADRYLTASAECILGDPELFGNTSVDANVLSAGAQIVPRCYRYVSGDYVGGDYVSGDQVSGVAIKGNPGAVVAHSRAGSACKAAS